MVSHTMLSKLLQWLLYQLLGNSCYRAAKKMKNYGFYLLKNPSFKPPPQQLQQKITTLSYPNLSKNYQNLLTKNFNTMVCDINGTLLRSQSFFPYFMLVAFEGGSIIRAFLLLISCSFLWVFDQGVQLRVMIFITFCGLKIKDMGFVERAVLPKFYLEELNFQVYQALVKAKCKVVFTSVPRVMVDGFLKEYLKVDKVVGTELHTFGSYFTGLLSSPGLVSRHRALKEYFGDECPDLGIGNSTFLDHLFLSSCKEAYVVNPQEDDKIGGTSTKMPRDKYPKPLIFHDGRLAFLPTPFASLSMFIWLPFGIPLAIIRLIVGTCFPQKISLMLGILTGIRLRTKGINPRNPNQPHKGVLYACTHRTLLDPVILSMSLGKPLTAVTYSLSKMSEIIAPIRTVRLVRDRKLDGEVMDKLLREGDLVVCPEGTTCREPYLLRFSSLFAELTEEIVPVGMAVKVSMFYGNTASGLKWLDPIFFMMNPRPIYYVHVMGKCPKELTCAAGKSSLDVANNLQRQLANALGFECTSFTRKDKYLMLAGNEGRVTSLPTN